MRIIKIKKVKTEIPYYAICLPDDHAREAEFQIEYYNHAKNLWQYYKS